LERARDLGSKEAERALRQERVPPNWWQWWFTAPHSSWPKRVVGGFLFALLVIYLLLPLFQEDVFVRLAPGIYILHLNTGQPGTTYALPVVALVVLLLWPSIRKVGGAGMALETIPPTSSTEELRPLPPR